MKTPDEIFTNLRRIAPNVCFSTHKESDPFFQWDGDGPDPVDEGLFPHNLLFTCTVIVDGDFKECQSSLGGSYYELGEPVGDAHGYLLQKLEEAANEMLGELQEGLTIRHQVYDAVQFLKEEQRREYEEQMAARQEAT